MKYNFINAITIDLIKKMNYIPFRNRYGKFSFASGYRAFEKRDVSTYSIIELIDADKLSYEEIEVHVVNNLKWLRKGDVSGMNESASVIEVFVFSEDISQNILSVISRNNYVDSRGRMLITNIVADIKNKKVLMPKGLKFQSDALRIILGKRIGDNLEGFEVLPELEKLVYEEDTEDDFTEISERSPATYVFIGINVAVWLIGATLKMFLGNDYVTMFGIKYAPLICAGEYWRLVTPMFLHADIAHLGANSFSLLIFGQVVERIFGTGRFILIYITAGIVGNIVSFAFTQAPSLGASGAVLGIGGALLYMWTRNRRVFSGRKRQYMTLVFLVFFNVFYGFSRTGIDNFAHIGGALSGFLTAGVICLKNKHIKKTTRFKYAALIFIISIICLFIGFT